MLRQTRLRRTEYDGRCYEGKRYLRNWQMHCPLTGGEPSLSRLPSGTPVEGGQPSLIRIFLPASISTQRRTEDEAGSPRVADRSGPLAVLCLVHLSYQNRYTMTGAKRQAWNFYVNRSWSKRGTNRGIQID